MDHFIHTWTKCEKSRLVKLMRIEKKSWGYIGIRKMKGYKIFALGETRDQVIKKLLWQNS